MKFHIITIFPEAFESFLSTSIIGKALNKKLFEIEFYKLNDFSPETSGHIDAKAFGMHGQVLKAEPLSRAIEHIFKKVWKKIPVIFFTPRWEILGQKSIEGFSETLLECVILCGHYEGIDERIIELFVDYQISLWEFVLTWGELPAQVFLDALIRHIPGVLSNSDSLAEESFSSTLDRKKEYPLYTRPQVFRGLEVPPVLLSGNHKDITNWKQTHLQ